jgi:hypothetical protein
MCITRCSHITFCCTRHVVHISSEPTNWVHCIESWMKNISSSAGQWIPSFYTDKGISVSLGTEPSRKPDKSSAQFRTPYLQDLVDAVESSHLGLRLPSDAFTPEFLIKYPSPYYRVPLNQLCWISVAQLDSLDMFACTAPIIFYLHNSYQNSKCCSR